MSNYKLRTTKVKDWLKLQTPNYKMTKIKLQSTNHSFTYVQATKLNTGLKNQITNSKKGNHYFRTQVGGRQLSRQFTPTKVTRDQFEFPVKVRLKFKIRFSSSAPLHSIKKY